MVLEQKIGPDELLGQKQYYQETCIMAPSQVYLLEIPHQCSHPQRDYR